MENRDPLAPPPPPDRTNVYVKKRKDGNYSAVYVYGRRISKIRTKEQLKADHDKGTFRLIGIDASEII